MSNDNQHVIKVIIWAIVVLAFMCVGDLCFMAYRGIQIPPELNTLASGLTGAIIAILTKTSPTSSQPAQPIEAKITNKPDEPVPTTESK